ncbi:MAG: hypothetical protein SGPRY_013408, partial [Prymnesium sp.]
REGWSWSTSGESLGPPSRLAAIEYKDLKQEVCASGILAAPHVLSALRRPDASPQQLADGCAALATLAEREVGRKEVLTKGAVDAIVGAMRACEAHPLVQEKGCSALANCAIGEGEGEVRAKGLALVLSAMGEHRGERGVQLKGCLALANCAFSTEGERDVLERGGVAAAIEAMMAQAGDVEVLEASADALANLAGGEEGKSEIVRAGGLQTLRAAQTTHPACESVNELLEALAKVDNVGS